MYHLANGLALIEYLLVLYFRPSLKSFPYVTFTGKLNEPLFGPYMLCMPVRHRHGHGVSWTILAIRRYDQGRFQLLPCSGFPKIRGPPPSDGRYIRVSYSLLHFVVTLLTRHVDGLDILPMLDSFIGPWEHS